MTEKITPDMAGCWLEGSQGWHNTYRIVDRAEEWGWTGLDEWEDGRGIVSRYAADAASDEDREAMSGQGGIADQAFDYLDSLTVSCHFERDAGELTLYRCQDLEDDGYGCDCEVKS